MGRSCHEPIYLSREGIVDEMHVRMRKRLDKTGMFCKIETRKQVDNVKVECLYSKNNSTRTAYLKQILGDYPSKNQMAQITLFDDEGKTLKAYQIFGITGFRRKGILRCTDIKGAEYINASDDAELLEAIKFIRSKFDDFTIDFINLNLKQIKREHNINMTPYCITKLVKKLPRENMLDKNSDCCYSR